MTTPQRPVVTDTRHFWPVWDEEGNCLPSEDSDAENATCCVQNTACAQEGAEGAICFFESCVPPKANHQAKRIVRVGGFANLADKPQLVQAKSFWDTLFLLHRPPAMLEGPLSLTMELTWPWNASDSKKTRRAGAMWHLGPPDLDNVGKTCTDSMCRCGYFRNDSQIVQLCLTKRRGDQPGVRVALAPTALALGARGRRP